MDCPAGGCAGRRSPPSPLSSRAAPGAHGGHEPPSRPKAIAETTAQPTIRQDRRRQRPVRDGDDRGGRGPAAPDRRLGPALTSGITPARSGRVPVSAAGALPTAAPIPAPMTANAAPAAITVPSPAVSRPRRVTPGRGQHGRGGRRRPADTAASTSPRTAIAVTFAASTRPRCGTSRNVVWTLRCVHSPAVDSTPRASSTSAVEHPADRRGSSRRARRWRRQRHQQMPMAPGRRAPGDRLAGAGGQGLADLEAGQRGEADGPVAGRPRRRDDGGEVRRSWRFPSRTRSAVTPRW